MNPNCFGIHVLSKRTGHTHVAVIPHKWLTAASFAECYNMAKIILRDGYDTAECIELVKFLRTKQTQLSNPAAK